MANFYDEVNICEHQYSRIVNTVNEDNLLLEDEVRASLPLLGEVDESATFCVRCRAIPNAVTVGHEYELQNPAADWGRRSPFPGHDNSRHLVVNGAMITPTTQYLITAPGDGADMPLLNDNEGFGGGLSVNRIGIEETEHCHAAVTLGSRHNSGAWHQLLAATVMCLLFMVAEVVGGYLAGSLAVMTDAAHLLSDFVGFLVSLFAVWIGRRAPTQKLSFGYHRAEILGALFSIAIIWIMTGVFVCLAVLRVVHQDFVIEADTMMIVAAIGVVINIIMGLVLHGVCLGLRGNHHHGHSHSTAVSADHHQNKPQQNINVRAAVIHVLGDLIQSVGVLVSAIVIKFYPNAKLVDPVCTFLFSLLVLSTTIPVLKDAAHVLMEGFPAAFNYTAIATQLTSLDGVRAVHNLHVWSLTLNKHALSAHLAIDRSADSDGVLRQALYLVKRKYDIHHVTIQVERYCASTMQDCLHCQAPKD